MNDTTLLDWVSLHLAVLHRPRFGAALLRYGGTASRVLHAPRAELPEFADVAWAALQDLRAALPWPEAEAAVRLCARRGITVVCRDAPEYPHSLRELADPPLLLFVRGDHSLLQHAAVAVVGTRKPSAYGLQITEALVRGWQGAGLAVVSGLAFGIDAAAHRAALAAGIPTVAVLASGVDCITPRGHYHLGERIAAEGVVCSEYPPGMGANPYHYPQRNRIISGLSLGVVVVEGAVQSGTMWTARHAAEQGRLVFAVPGGAGHIQSAGPHHLIREGAILVERSEHVLEALAPLLGRVPIGAPRSKSAISVPVSEIGTAGRSASENRRPVTETRQCPGPDVNGPDPYGLGPFLQTPRQLPEIVAQAGVSVMDVLQWLTHAELNGLVRREPRGYVL